jgi:hypothetical protein
MTSSKPEMEPEETSIAKQLLGKHASATRRKIELLLKDFVFCESVPRLHNEDLRPLRE